MSGKLFGLFLLVVAIVVGVAVFALFDDSSAPVVPEDGTEVQAPPARDGTPDPGTGPEVDRVAPVAPPREGQPTRVEAESPGYDPTGDLVVTGRVTSARNGSPIAEAMVEVLYVDGDELASGSTAADGTYRIAIEDGIPPRVAFRCWAEGFATQSQVGAPVGRDSRELTVDFALRSHFTIRGQVTAADGRPIEDADVSMRSLSPLYDEDWEDATTDENGWYVMEGVEDLPREGFDLVAESPAHAPVVKAKLVVPPDQDEMRVDFVLWELLVLTGNVVSARNQAPIEDAEVSAASADPEYVDNGEDDLTDADGSFEIELDAVPFEGMFVLVSAEEHAARRVAPLPAPDAQGRIRLGAIALRDGVTVAGMVINAVTGVPVPGGDVTVYSIHAPDQDEGEYIDSEVIDDAGRFELALEYAPPDEAELLIETDGYLPLRKHLTIPPDATRHEERFLLTPVITLKGSVRRVADQSPVAGARVRLLGSATQLDDEGMVARAGADGVFLLELPAEPSRFAIVVEYGDQRFPQGRLEPPPSGSFEVVKEFVVDLPPLKRPGR